MSTDSYMEYFAVFFGWVINNAIWEIFLGTGLFALPLALKIAAIWLKVREEGDDEGNKGSLALARIENVIYIAFVVIMFCVLPIQSVDIHTMKFDKERSTQCGVNVPSPQKSGYAAVMTDFDGQSAAVPVWWYLVHSLSKGITRATVASIPCGTNLRQLRFEVQRSWIKDPILVEEIQSFANQCYAKAHYRLKVKNKQLTDKTFNDVSWIGSDYFLDTSGYYDYYTSTEPRAAWPYQENRDSGYPDVKRGGYPSCKEWWSDGDIGLKDRVLKNVGLPTMNRAKKALSQPEETLLRILVSPRHTTVSGSGESYLMGPNDHQTSLGGNIKRLASTVGVGWNQMSALPGFDAMKQALPIVQALLEMVIIIAIPILVLFSAFSPKVVLTISFAMFALIFVSFWWELASWLDDRLIRILYDSMNAGGGGSLVPFASFVGSTSDGWIMNLVLGGMYVAMPMVWFGVMGWTGVSIGSFINQTISNAGDKLGSAGSKGSGLIQGAASAAITKGKSLSKK